MAAGMRFDWQEGKQQASVVLVATTVCSQLLVQWLTLADGINQI
jgi:hypothetical protein